MPIKIGLSQLSAVFGAAGIAVGIFPGDTGNLHGIASSGMVHIWPDISNSGLQVGDKALCIFLSCYWSLRIAGFAS